LILHFLIIFYAVKSAFEMLKGVKHIDQLMMLL